MLSRLLPPSEWHRLAETDLRSVVAGLDPSWVQVLVVEDKGAIVGCLTLMNVWHLEGLWIAPAYRQRVSVARRLWVGIHRLMAYVGAGAAVAGSITPEMDQMLAERASALPGRFYVLPRGEQTCLRQSSAA